MREVACYLCGRDDGTLLFRQRGHDPYLGLAVDDETDIRLEWRVCDFCGFVYRSPRLDDDEMGVLYQHYEEDVFANRDPDSYFDRIIQLPPDESENHQKVTWLLDELARANPGICDREIRVLDVGCGGGTLLHSLSLRTNLKALCGVELNPAYAKLAGRRLKADVRNQAYQARLFEFKFELVVCAKVLEHVRDPIGMLTQMNDDVLEDGYVFVEVPDISDMFVLPPDHERFYIPHIYFFSESTLSELLRRSGFKPVSTRSIRSHRDRSYLQILARKTDSIGSASPPFDQPEKIVARVSANMTRHNAGPAS